MKSRGMDLDCKIGGGMRHVMTEWETGGRQKGTWGYKGFSQKRGSAWHGWEGRGPMEMGTGNSGCDAK